MKKNQSPEVEQQFRDDVNLREALRRRYADEPQLPADFARKLQERIRVEREKQQASIRPRWWWNVAAIFVGVLLMSGVVFAVVQWVVPVAPKVGDMVGSDSVVAMKTRSTQGTVVFDNVRLDSILAVVAGHYGRTVCFRDEETRQWRLSTSWKMEEPLETFVGTLNEFDGLQLIDERDTVFVELMEEEEDEE